MSNEEQLIRIINLETPYDRLHGVKFILRQLYGELETKELWRLVKQDYKQDIKKDLPYPVWSNQNMFNIFKGYLLKKLIAKSYVHSN